MPDQRPANSDDRHDSRPRGVVKRRYEAPRLIEYGSVAKLTQTGGMTTKDAGNMKRVCL